MWTFLHGQSRSWRNWRIWTVSVCVCLDLSLCCFFSSSGLCVSLCWSSCFVVSSVLSLCSCWFWIGFSPCWSLCWNLKNFCSFFSCFCCLFHHRVSSSTPVSSYHGSRHLKSCLCFFRVCFYAGGQSRWSGRTLCLSVGSGPRSPRCSWSRRCRTALACGSFSPESGCDCVYPRASDHV